MCGHICGGAFLLQSSEPGAMKKSMCKAAMILWLKEKENSQGIYRYQDVRCRVFDVCVFGCERDMVIFPCAGKLEV